jgi:hypothetical protein
MTDGAALVGRRSDDQRLTAIRGVIALLHGREEPIHVEGHSIQLFPILVRQFEQGQALREAILLGL